MKRFWIVLLFATIVCSFALASDDKVLSPKEVQAINDWFGRAAAERADIPKVIAAHDDLSADSLAAVQDVLWQTYKQSPRGQVLKQTLPAPHIIASPEPQLTAKSLKTGEKTMPFIFLGKGELSGLRPLFIALHGGGSAGGTASSPHGWSVNTRKWKGQAHLAMNVYPDNALYFVPRMADDNDGRWYYDYCQDAYDRVIRAAILHHNVDPDRVYLIGISEGAYTAYRLGAFMADRWAGAGSMAGGEPLNNAPPENMRNLAFRADIGQHDTMFDRVGLNRRYGEALKALRKDDPNGFRHMIKVHAGRGHGIDYRECPKWISQYTRNPRPQRIRWKAIEVHGRCPKHSYWLAMDASPESYPLYIDAALDAEANAVTISVEKDGPDEKRLPADATGLRIYLDDTMLDLGKPVRVIRNGKQVFSGRVSRRIEVMMASLAERGDPRYVFPAEIVLPQTTEAGQSSEKELSKLLSKNERSFVEKILRRAGQNRENVAAALLAGGQKGRTAAMIVLSQTPPDELTTLKQAALTQQINTIAPALARVSEEQQMALANALCGAGANRQELIDFLQSVTDQQVAAAVFLVVNMPQRDRLSLKKDFLMEQVKLAGEAWEKSPWGKEVPEQLFLQYILPYANLNEQRDNWRGDFMERLQGKAWSFETPVEAVIWLNTELNDLFKVYYHATKRPKADQSPYESIEAGYASCTGLSILLVDSCRSVGIPARIVGVPRWKKVPGNHNWVEIWDGQWYNVGGTGSDPRNDDWVNERCLTETDPDQWPHSVYAACFRKTPLHFPLVWDAAIDYVPALNITRFYSAKKEVEIDVPGSGRGVVEVVWAGEIIARRAGEKSVPFTLAEGHRYDVSIKTGDGKVHQETLQL